MTIKAVLIDRRNYDQWVDALIKMVSQPKPTGIDLETDNYKAHAGIQSYGKDVFDLRRQVITGLSLWTDGEAAAFYFNLNHKDEENRLTWPEVKRILDAKHPDALWIAHNATFECAMLKSVYDFDLRNFICTMQMAVSAYNQDQYDKNLLFTTGLGGIAKVLGTAAMEFSTFTNRNSMTAGQSEVFTQVIGKSSKADHSYNGLVRSIAYGYGLKQAVASHFGHKMTTYKETVGDGSMKDLTGDEVLEYGADDAYWCVRLFHHLKEFMLNDNPEVLKTFLTQELPMVQVYADTWRGGLRVNFEAINKRRQVEREEYGKKLVRLKTLIRGQLPFKPDPHRGLIDDDKAYANLYVKYRSRIGEWAAVVDDGRTMEDIVLSVSGSVADGWAKEIGALKGELNFGYYMTQRVIMYDLLEQKCIKYKGAVQSDGEARGKLLDRLEGEKKEIVKLLNELTDIEQRMKLYLNPYLQLADPETGRVYPQLSSQLNTRRLAASFPNPMQLAKRGESTYVRGFYLPDTEDEVIVSLDWSQFELVIIGELSGDPEFAKAYSQLPFGDLHTGATVDCLQVTIPEITLDLFKKLGGMTPEEVDAINPKLLLTPEGKKMAPAKAKSFWRTSVGKGANFNYWYSGALSTVGDTLGWTPDQMWAATEKYREIFSVAEEWRVRTIRNLQRDGYLQLPDNHRRVRFEATPEWAHFFQNQFTARERYLGLPHKGLSTFGTQVVKSIQTRANNQGVNAMVQGTNAFCAKRSIIRILKEVERLGLRVRFMMPVHDELVWSVNKADVIEFIAVAKRVMRSHEDVFKTLKLDCTASIGRTFEPYDSVKAPLGQIELSEIQFDFGKFKRGEAVDDITTSKLLDEVLFKDE